MPQNMARANICITRFSHGRVSCAVAPLDTIGASTTCAMTAPTLPAAADTPCAVARILVGKHSAGTMKVVAFGPGDVVSCMLFESARLAYQN